MKRPDVAAGRARVEPAGQGNLDAGLLLVSGSSGF